MLDRRILRCLTSRKALREMRATARRIKSAEAAACTIGEFGDAISRLMCSETPLRRAYGEMDD